eukprot:TRINITY_DN68035_c10_g1_i1.p1 TRINITY_DN68035_c10_g1~~TRINITY_DN68035_c10_g1_i1.p1  ORF type:complete len:336 (-),score=12.79 TRINITY_DN68035_c10_g1_i1:132-1139(-)
MLCKYESACTISELSATTPFTVYTPAKLRQSQATELQPEKLLSDTDRRSTITPSWSQWLRGSYTLRHSIGRLRMRFNHKNYVGTGTLVGIGKHSDKVLTCAHNCIHVSDTGQQLTPQSIQFELNGSKYPVSHWAVYPKYNPTTDDDDFEHDVALLVLQSPITLHRAVIVHPQSELDGSETPVAVVGFPGECTNNVLKGMIGSAVCENELFKYVTVDTTGGQSGSPVIEARLQFPPPDNWWGEMSSLSSLDQLHETSNSGMDVLLVGAVHVFGSRKRNGACAFTLDKVKWLANKSEELGTAIDVMGRNIDIKLDVYHGRHSFMDCAKGPVGGLHWW